MWKWRLSSCLKYLKFGLVALNLAAMPYFDKSTAMLRVTKV
jgi:hypothetical protein